MAESRVSAWVFRDGHRLYQRRIRIQAFITLRDENNRSRPVGEIGQITSKKNSHFIEETKFHSPIRLSIAQDEQCVSLPVSTSANRVCDRYAKQQRSLPQAHLWK